MPSTSKAQQRLMGMAYAYKKGELKASEVSSDVKELADNMTLQDLKDFASTKHKGLPEIAENITPAGIGGMGPVVLPMNGGVGSGDVPAGRGDAEEEYKKKLKKRMKHLKTLESFSFDYQGTEIRNPFTDETAIRDVDPNGYYGKEYAKSDIKKIVDASEAFIAKYTEWKDMQPFDEGKDLHVDYGQHVGTSLDELVKIVKKYG